MVKQLAVLLFLISALPFHGDNICEWGLYGDNCNQTCPENCRVNPVKNLTHCQRETGRCSDGCKHGWYGYQCDHFCSKTCPGNVCNQETGHCIYPCDGKTTGDFCEITKDLKGQQSDKESTTVPNEEEKESESDVTIIVVSLAVAIFLLPYIIIGIFRRRIIHFFRRKDQTRNNHSDLEGQQSDTERSTETESLLKDNANASYRLIQECTNGPDDKVNEDWERLFVKTAAYQEVRDQLQQHNLVMLTGGPGEGKTTIGHMLCCDYQQQGYNTVFCSRWEHFNMDVFQATKPTLVVIDDMGHHCGFSYLVREIHNKTKANKLVHVLIIYKSYKGDNLLDVRIVDTTQIGRQNWDRTKQEYSQMLQMQTDIPSDTREDIIANLPSYVGFPKVMKHFCQDRPSTDPVTFFTYPHSHFRKEIESLLGNVDFSAAITYILVSGNKVKDNYRNQYESDGSDDDKYGLGEFQSLFPELKTINLSDMLHTLCATYLCQSGGNISFTDPVIYDACVFAVDNKLPGLLWKNSKVMCETGNTKSLPDIPDKTIFISRHNTDMFLTQLVEDTRRGKFRHTFRHPVLSREDNIDRFMTQLGDSFVDVLHLQDTTDSSTDSGSLLYWVLQSGNNYLCQKVLQKQELSQVHVSEEQACFIRRHDTKSFLHLRQQLLGLQRGDITYTPDYTDADGDSLLMMAVDRNNANMVNILLKDDAECLIKNKSGNSALHLACFRGCTDIVKLLLPHMEDWKNLTGQDLRTPVMIAALKGLDQLYEYLTDEGKCDLTGVDDNGDTILHLACQGGSVQIVKHMMSSKLFDINHRGQFGKTPLMIAACRGHRDVFQLLLSQNCHITPEDFSMSETLSYGHVGDCLNMSQFLRAREHGLNRCMMTHKKHYISKLKSHLEEKGSSMLLVDVSGLSLLHTAAETGNLKLAEFLLSKGKVDINTRDASGRTPVMVAAAAGHRIMFEFLTKKQCDWSLKDTESHGVLPYASQGGNFGIVQGVGQTDIIKHLCRIV